MAPPLTYLCPIFPGFQLLDLCGPLDILNLLSQISPSASTLKLTLIAESLDPVPVKPIPPPGADWKYDIAAAYPAGKVNLTFNEYLIPDTTYASLLASQEKYDVLLLPGGVGTRLMRIAPDGSTYSNIKPLLDFLPKIAPHITTALLTVCTGSDALAQTGLLTARRATTNMSLFENVVKRNPGVQWQNFSRWVRSLTSEATDAAAGSASHLEIWTSAGISAGMDVTLAFIAHHYGGVEVARDLAKRLEYDWREIGEGERDPLYSKFYKD